MPSCSRELAVERFYRNAAEIVNMRQIGNFTVMLFLSIAITKVAFSQISPKAEIQEIRESMIKTHRDIDWNAFDTTSKIPIDSINIQALQGVWKAYNGIFRFNGSVNSMALTTPLVLELKDDKYRTELQGTFKKFALKKNYIEAKEENWRGYINSISDKILVITWNNGENRNRYYYEK
jgi:hypothetical protein